ncbi:LCP family protein [Ornithinibacillus sp. BX22]|uniref:Polyisoprenyl-teichoic acid--peptidoglycan teichoic acid transferase TagU n=2 Tax=Ornithinibacillus TaxID=484508 RepID=A0A923L7H9_9BACI|nr:MULTISPECIES: LCP family protein [Ornithinibacillus]MBC5637921.1 LCP family protein [Ornithinibacillus hominis]MBS3681715.1 LCP family protein [Ornithinibacillus massiliensis]
MTVAESRKELKQKKRRKWLYWVGGILLFLLLAGGGFAWYVWDKIHDTVNTMHEPLDRDKDPKRQEEINSIFKDKKSINILLLGVDEREGDRGRSDTMILMSLNPKTDSMKMLSIPRDTYVNIPGRGMDKINHAYAFGGVELSVQTVEEAFDLPVHFYGKINMEGFELGVDALGGVTIDNHINFTQDGFHFEEGNIRLNGKEALAYIRMRKSDPRGDMGRNERQRAIVTAAMNEAASFSSITKVGEILDIVGNNVNTDLQMKNMQALFTNYLGTRANIDTMEISGSGQIIGGIWYYIVPEAEFSRISTEIKDHMEAN